MNDMERGRWKGGGEGEGGEGEEGGQGGGENEKEEEKILKKQSTLLDNNSKT